MLKKLTLTIWLAVPIAYGLSSLLHAVNVEPKYPPAKIYLPDLYSVHSQIKMIVNKNEFYTLDVKSTANQPRLKLSFFRAGFRSWARYYTMRPERYLQFIQTLDHDFLEDRIWNRLQYPRVKWQRFMREYRQSMLPIEKKKKQLPFKGEKVIVHSWYAPDENDANLKKSEIHALHKLSKPRSIQNFKQLAALFNYWAVPISRELAQQNN